MKNKNDLSKNTFLDFVLTACLIGVFSFSAIEAGLFAYKQTAHNNDLSIIVIALFCMMVSGLGLIIILLLKLRKLEQASREKKQAMELLISRMAAIESAADGIGFVDKNGNMTYMNKALIRLHGIEDSEAESFIGKPWQNLYNEQGQEDVVENVMPILEKEHYWEGESPIQRKDGEVIWCEMSLTLLEDGGYIGTARDVTMRKKDEQDKEMLQRQFFHAQKMEAIGRLAGGIAHDFNNILASMLGYTEFLMEDLPQDSKEHHYASKIFAGSMQAQKMIDQILSFSRRKKSAMEFIDLVESLEETVDMLQPMIPTSIAMDISVDADEAPIEGNASHIGQALVNLCVNAIDAIAEDHGKINLGVEVIVSDQTEYPDMLIDTPLPLEEEPPVDVEDAEEGLTRIKIGRILKGLSYVRVSVSDTGCGMPKDVMMQAFEPFFTTKPVDHGTGLGLSSVNGVVAAHGGAIIVESKEHEGTKFVLLFPLSDSSGSASLVSPALNQDILGSGEILLVEDEEPVREMLSQALERLGYSSFSCSDGDEAVDHLRENPSKYDLIISDYAMPRMTGAEMAKEIAEDFPDLPIILLSGYSKRRLKNIMIENPSIKAVLRKPVKREILSKNIYAILKGKEAA